MFSFFIRNRVFIYFLFGQAVLAFSEFIFKRLRLKKRKKGKKRKKKEKKGKTKRKKERKNFIEASARKKRRKMRKKGFFIRCWARLQDWQLSRFGAGKLGRRRYGPPEAQRHGPRRHRSMRPEARPGLGGPLPISSLRATARSCWLT